MFERHAKRFDKEIENEDALLKRTRVETANALGNAMIDVMNDHMREHGTHDPMVPRMLAAAMASVVDSVQERVEPEFGLRLVLMLEPYWKKYFDVDDRDDD